MSHGKKTGPQRPARPSRDVNVTGNIEVDVSQDLIRKYDASGNQQNKWKRRNFILAVASALIVAAYTSLAAWQAYLIRDSNEISRESLESVQRAFVTFQRIHSERLKMTKDGVSFHFWQFQPAIENSGTTPAVEAMNTDSIDKRKTEPSDAEFEGHSNTTVRETIGPKRILYLNLPNVREIQLYGLDFGENPESIGTVDSDGGQWFIWGWVFYRDVFKSTPWHLTEFCQVMSSGVVDDKTKRMIPAFKDCDHHNCTDEQCPNYGKMVADIAK